MFSLRSLCFFLFNLFFHICLKILKVNPRALYALNSISVPPRILYLAICTLRITLILSVTRPYLILFLLDVVCVVSLQTLWAQLLSTLVQIVVQLYWILRKGMITNSFLSDLIVSHLRSHFLAQIQLILSFVYYLHRSSRFVMLVLNECLFLIQRSVLDLTLTLIKALQCSWISILNLAWIGITLSAPNLKLLKVNIVVTISINNIYRLCLLAHIAIYILHITCSTQFRSLLIATLQSLLNPLELLINFLDRLLIKLIIRQF